MKNEYSTFMEYHRQKDREYLTFYIAGVLATSSVFLIILYWGWQIGREIIQ